MFSSLWLLNVSPKVSVIGNDSNVQEFLVSVIIVFSFINSKYVYVFYVFLKNIPVVAMPTSNWFNMKIN